MNERFIIQSQKDIRIAIYATRDMANKLLFSEVDLQKLIVSVSELTQNILDHTTSQGTFSCETIDRNGIRIIVEDNGGGIKPYLNGGPYSGKRGLGLGLAGSKRLMDEFNIETSERGTKVIAIKWRSC